ncbi:unnamed protein product [Rotaria sordida]|uniref:Uncharacterized protein n=1 Tax=Rotaria sordida TaxID=392033 RepID=A0A814WUD8_9BILA|nr:unnamed protein product [Rotaria sordida]CAF1208868.1 unnamed protein product [Rotaria sordida]CAF1221907.1 unnamed protein product [Rotaria sordida]CAF3724622.1 unnamed protein product [Rotaria sordida]
MNNTNLSPTYNTSARRIYQRRNRKNRTTTVSSRAYFPLTTTIVIRNTTLLINSSSVPINDLFAPLSYLLQHKYIFLIGLSLLIALCLISILFLIFILKCTKGWKIRRQNRKDKKILKTIPDFIVDQHDTKDENAILLEPNGGINSLTNNSIITNGILPKDNISNTFSLGSMLEQKIIKNNSPNAIPLLPMADDASIDTLRGSLISSPSQQISVNQLSSTPTYATTTDSAINSDDRALEAEKDDDLHDLDLKRIMPRYTKATNNSSSNILAHRSSGSSLEQSIRRQERRAEEEERGLLHGSNSNLYEKELRRIAEQEKFARKEHTNSQVSLASRTSEDSCY